MSESLEQIALRLAPRKNGTLESDKYGFVNDAALVAYVSKVVAALGAQTPAFHMCNGKQNFDTPCENCVPFYAAPVVKEGWKMVPEEKELGLGASYEDAAYVSGWNECRAAMLSAAPEYGK